MVQYILTPWRDRQELLLVREQFYSASTSTAQQQQPQPSSKANTTIQDGIPVPARVNHAILVRVDISGDAQDGSRLDDTCAAQPDDAQSHMRTSLPPNSQAQPSQHDTDNTGDTGNSPNTHWQRQRHRQRQAVARVSMWMQRGNCPHMVESTALLTAAMLSDDGLAGGPYAVRAAYSAAFSRFVTGLLDGHQDKQRKQSMYSIAKTIGLPATFVELRHQATHEQLPSLAKLRSAAKKALDWIWNYYWKHLVDDELTAPKSDPCRDIVLGYLRGGEESHTMRALERFGKTKILNAISDVQATLPGNQVYLQCLKLSREVMIREDTHVLETDEVDELDEADHADMGGDGKEGDAKAVSSSGWGLYEGPWQPKPIGMV
ncbi:hypothetical protein E4U55_002140 [Claviceps digitariae]|nr:hypothetical protein E4U55_002140 [Claviceps digitariae]